MGAPPILGPVSSIQDLSGAVAGIAKRHPDCLLLDRGQTRLHPQIRSGRARQVFGNEEVEAGWRSLARRMLGLPAAAEHSGHVKAVLQHYGLATNFVDLS